MIKDEVLALCELSNDLLYHKIPKDKLSYYIREALSFGRKSAKEYHGKDILQLCNDNNIEIEYIKECKKNYGVSFRAQTELDQKHTKILIYEGSIKELSKHSSDEARKALSYEEALAIHLAHEFFHYLEYTRLGFVSESFEEIVTFKLPLITRKARIQRLSEIAAHAFAKELLALKELPNIYDYYYLINSGHMKKVDFDGMIVNYEKMLLVSND
jgi:hypothetical protein